MSAESSGRKGVDSENVFEFQLELTPLFTQHDGTQTDVEDTKAVFQCFRDIILVQKLFHLEKYPYVHMKKISPDLQITFFAHDQSEFDQFSEAVKDELIQKGLVNFAGSAGLEVQLGIIQDKNVHLDFELTVDKKLQRKAKSHFSRKTQTKHVQSEKKKSTQMSMTSENSSSSGGKNDQNEETPWLQARGSKKQNSIEGLDGTEMSPSSVDGKVQSEYEPGSRHEVSEQNLKPDSGNVPENLSILNARCQEEEKPSGTADQLTVQLLTGEVHHDQNMVLKTHFILYIDATVARPKDICEVNVFMQDPSGKCVHVNLFRGGQKGIWMSDRISLPADLNTISYCYEVKIAQKSWVPFRTRTDLVLSTAQRTVTNNGSTVCDFFNFCRVEEGYAEHIENLLERIDLANLKDGIMQVDSLNKIVGRLTRVQLQTTFEILHRCILHNQRTFSTSSFILIAYVYASTVVDYLVLMEFKYITSEAVLAILNSLCAVQTSDIPSDALRRFQAVAVYFMKIAFRENACMLVMMEFCYPLLTSAYFSHLIVKSKSDMPFIKGLSDSEVSKVSEEVLQKICNEIENGSKDAGDLLQTIMRHCPLEFALHVKNKVLKFSQLDIMSKMFWDRIKHECQFLEKGGNFAEILNLYKVLSEHEFMTTDFAFLLTSAVETVISSVKKNQSFDEETVMMLLTCQGLFQNSESCERLVKKLSVSENKSVHLLFIRFLSCEVARQISLSTLQACVSEWLETAIHHHCSDKYYPRPVDDLSKLYHYLHMVTSVKCVSENDDMVNVLKDRVFQFLTDVPIEDLMQKVSEKDFMENSDVQQIFKTHFQRCLFGGKTKTSLVRTDLILQRIVKSSSESSFQVNTWLYGDILKIMMEFSGLQECSSTTDGILLMLKNLKFWVRLMTVQGSLSFLIVKHNVFCKANKIINEFRNQLHQFKVTCSVVRKVQNVEKDSDHDIVKDLLCTDGKSQKKEIVGVWKFITESVKNTEHDLKMMNRLLEQIQNRFGKDKVQDVDDALKLVEEKGDEFMEGSNVKICDLKDGSFWQPIGNALHYCQEINKLSFSEVFWTISERLVEQRDLDSDEGTKCGSAEESISLLYGEEILVTDPVMTSSVLHLLATKGRDQYEESWKLLFKEIAQKIMEIKDIILVSDLDSEVEIAEECMNSHIPERIMEALHTFKKFHIYEDKMKVATSFLKVLNIEISSDTSFAGAIDSFNTLKKGDPLQLTLNQLYEAGTLMRKLDCIISSDMFSILQELASSVSLIQFLREIADEDLRNLIDAVEEHSEQFVQAVTVSSLIEVKRFLNPILKESFDEKNIEAIFSIMQKSISIAKISKLDIKINDCKTHLHGLKSLYYNVANRGEVTKEIVKKTIQQKGAKFEFALRKDRMCDVKLGYTHQGKKTLHSKSDVNDLRSRVLLLANAEEKSGRKKAAKLQDDLQTFVERVDSAMSIANLYEQLSQSGHPDYLTPERKITLEIASLGVHLERMREDLEIWEKELGDSRSQHYWLNYFFPEQLWTVRRFMKSGTDKGNIRSLLLYAGCDPCCLDTAQNLYSEIAGEEGEEEFALKAIGKTLDELLKHTEFSPKAFPRDKQVNLKMQRMADAVQEGQIFIAVLDEGSNLIIPTLMALYRNTTGYLPLPHQVLFCQNDTKWEAIQLLLLRCLGSKGKGLGKQLFCIVGVENLPTEEQFNLADELKAISQQEFPCLSVICRGGIKHPFLDHFAENIHHVQPMSPTSLESCFRNLWPEVVTITSDVSGQGKTELIYQMANSKDMDIVTLHVSGELSTSKLVSQMSQLEIFPYHVLHIDAGLVSDPVDLDILLFRLIVLGFLSHESTVFHLPTKYVSIEIANSINNILKNGLQTTMYFHRKHLKWESFSNLKVSQEICSPVQIVCHYLNSLQQGKIDTTDLYFSGPNSVKALSSKLCQDLLRNYFSKVADLSFTIVDIFLNVLADQLKKLSCSYYFRSANILGMLGDEEVKNVKSGLLRALLEVSCEFATRSVQACRLDQTLNVSSGLSQSQTIDIKEKMVSVSASAEAMSKRVESMIQWSESNHLVAFHNQDIQTLSAIYRDKKMIPKHITELFETQVHRPLPDFAKLNQRELQEILQRIARFKPGLVSQDAMDKIGQSYALTPDNLLKMVLIILRIKAQIPVIIMGETGCGKTSLLRYLSQVCGVQFQVQNIHAGVERKDIIQRVMAIIESALANMKEPMWMFLDEINTCNHLGLINDIICHHSCQGLRLASNLVLMAACNPYKLRNGKTIYTAGLDAKVKADEQSRLVYRVHPLPESMVDYVWDYGCLSADDEKAYITRMLKNVVKTNIIPLVDLLVMSQDFLRTEEQTESCVSLRDVNRCRLLIEWFHQMLKHKTHTADHSQEWLETRSVILALAHSYHCRLSNSECRKQYRERMAKLFQSRSVGCGNTDTSEEGILKVIQDEQRDILHRMDVPEGTATNIALQENVFVVMVCILTRIPIFLVGKPGCSKSLSLQLIKSNLRGKDSKDPYFQTLPQLYCVSFQGSESSTSDGIIKVFEKAKQYRKHNKEDDVLPVVILDEIGLAEVSRFNPLKVLHSLLEPGDEELPDVAVVGISNWALDAAKMNRAVHLSRPEMDLDELYQTGVSISEASTKEKKSSKSLIEPVLKCNNQGVDKELLKAIAGAYHEYIEHQRFKNFHGLRDFYSLVKYISREFSKLPVHEYSQSEKKMDIMMRGLLRNFGGLTTEMQSVVKTYKKHLKKAELLKTDTNSVVTKTYKTLDFIEENIADETARHLMLITFADAALSIVEVLLRKMDREYVTILGSHFEEDLTDDYNYRILSRIILCMEQGVVLILKDLESIYGSLYDMLNQNYTIVGKKRNCRIALGAYSNPLCQVHENFRCIVLVDEQKLDLSDPPFLNRFEKQQLLLTDDLTHEQVEIVQNIETWIQDITTIPGYEHVFQSHGVIPIYGPDMVASLVHHVCSVQKDPIGQKQTVDECKNILLKMCTPEAVLRIERTAKTELDWTEVDELQKTYFDLPAHSGLENYLKFVVESKKTLTDGVKTIVFTHSNLHTSIADCFEIDAEELQVEKMGAFKSEKQLSSKIRNFWLESSNKWLIVQCAPHSDMGNFLLMKSIIERYRKEHSVESGDGLKKHVVIIVHMDRTEAEQSLQVVNFLSGWELAVVDMLEKKYPPLTILLDKTIGQLIEDRRPVTGFISEHLFWAFTCISYTNKMRNMQSFSRIKQTFCFEDELMTFFEDILIRSLRSKRAFLQKQKWQLDVACNAPALYSFTTLYDALEHEITVCLRHPLAALVYQIEVANAWDTFSNMTELCSDKCNVWKEHCSNTNILDISTVQPPSGPECYICSDMLLSFQHPFSRVFIMRIERLKDFFIQTLHAKKNECGYEEELPDEFKEELYTLFLEPVKQTVPELFEHRYGQQQLDDYFHDFCNIMSSRTNVRMEEQRRIQVMRWALMSMVSLKQGTFPEFVTKLHITWWLHAHYLEAEVNLIDACLQVTDVQLDDIFTACSVDQDEKKSEHESEHEDDKEELKECDAFEAFPSLQESFPDKEENSPGDKNDLDLGNTAFVGASGSDLMDLEHSETADIQIKLQPESKKLQLKDEYVADPDAVKISTEEYDSETRSQAQEELLLQDDALVFPQTEKHTYATDKEKEYVYSETSTQQTGEVLNMENDNAVNIGGLKLVDFACEQLIPTRKMFKSDSSLELWMENVSLVLSLVTEVSVEPKILQCLRVCSDFASLIVIPHSLNRDYVWKFGQKLKGDDIESRHVFDSILHILSDLVDRNKVPLEVLQHFFACYLSACLASDPDCETLLWTFQQLDSCKILTGRLNLFGPTLHHAFLIEIGKNPDIPNDEEIETCPFLNGLNQCLQELDPCSDTCFAVASLCVDILQHFLLGDLNLSADIGDFKNSEIIKKLLVCDEIYKSGECSIKHLFAAAAVKTIVKSLADLVKKAGVYVEDLQPILQKTQGVFNSGGSDTTENGRTESLQLFFIKCIVEGSGRRAFGPFQQALCGNYDFCKTSDVTNNSCTPLELSSLKLHLQDIIPSISEAFDKFSEDKNPLTKAVNDSRNNPQFMYGFFVVILEKLFLVQAVRTLTESERNVARSLVEQIVSQHVPANQRTFLECLSSVREFDFPVLQLSPSSSIQNYHVASFLVQLFSCVFAFNQNEDTVSKTAPLSLRCLQSPDDVEERYLPACSKLHSSMKHIPLVPNSESISEMDFYVCTCSYISAAVDESCPNDHCMVCFKTVEKEQIKKKRFSFKDDCAPAEVGYHYIDPDNLIDTAMSVRQVSPVAFRIMLLMLHGCFAGSLALGYSTGESLSKVLNIPEGVDVILYIQKHIEIHWEVLKTLTRCGDVQLGRLLQVIIKLQESVISKSTCQFLTEEDLEEFENVFTKKVDEIFQKRFHCIQKEFEDFMDVNQDGGTDVEVALGEIVDDSEKLGSLMRETLPPTIENLKSEFMILGMARFYPLLGLIFLKEKQLSLLEHMLPIIHWHLCTVRYVSYRMKKVDCEKKTIEEFIHDFQKDNVGEFDDHKKSPKNIFDAFKDSWNTLRVHETLLREYNKNIPQLKRVHSKSKLHECLMTDKSSALMQVILALHQIHNEFIDDAVILSLSLKNPSTSFLRKSSDMALIPSIHTEEITGKQIVTKPDLDSMLKFSQCSTVFGGGKQVQYDFYQIEMQLADTCLVNKPYLQITSSFPQIIFSGDWLHRSASLFEDVRTLVGQVQLDKDTKNSVKQLQEKNPANLQTLLDYLEMTFYLLKRVPLISIEKDQYLSEYLATWHSLFPCRVPAVEGFCTKIKLCNILALYEFVEDLLADVVVESLEDKYRKPVSEDAIDQLESITSVSTIKMLQTLVLAVKRFAFRYLSTSSADINDQLSFYMMESSLWPDGVVDKVNSSGKKKGKETGLLPNQLCVEHIVETIAFLEESIEEKVKREEKRLSTPAVPQKKTGCHQQRRKAAKEFRKK